MIVKQKLGNIRSYNIGQKTVDLVTIEWFEANKRILHKKSKAGKDIVMKFMSEGQDLTEGDILMEDESTIVAVEIQACEAIMVHPISMYQMASLGYEIGNKHLPMFYSEGEIMVPYEEPLFKLLSAAGYEPKRENRKLCNPLKTTVSPHNNIEGKQSLFSKILQLTTANTDV